MPNTLIQMLLRASNAVGYSNYPDNVVKKFIEEASQKGVDVFRIFDSLNWVENMKMPIETALKTGKIVEGTICYTGDITDPNETKYTLDYYVKKAKEYIKNGDIFQVVLSQRFEIDTDVDPFDVYRCLRTSNPSPYLYFFDFIDYQVVGASPEKLVSVLNGIVATKPIAGTVPRGRTKEEDDMLVRQLVNDPKERAEHTMLVDLGRNDVGKVSKFGTVEVKNFMTVEKYSKVTHLVSDVQGELRDDENQINALMSVLPAGTLSGAPKVRAMEIIDELENKKRGVYGGTVGYLGFDGNIDTCIAIRTVVFKDGKGYVQAGAGIVNDSVPEKEFMETKNKALAVVNAVKEAAKL